MRLRGDGMSATLYEYEPGSPGGPDRSAYAPGWPPRFALDDFREPAAAGGAGDSDARAGPRKSGTAGGRLFDVFAEAQTPHVTADRVAALNDALDGVRVSPGDFFPGSVEPARFPDRPGWHTGTNGRSERYPQGEYTVSWAATVPYGDEPLQFPPHRTLAALPSDGIVIHLTLSRDARFPPRPPSSPGEPQARPPGGMADLRPGSIPGDPQGIGVYNLAVYVGRYQMSLYVLFAREQPTAAMRAEADAMVAGLRLPDWGAWERDARKAY